MAIDDEMRAHFARMVALAEAEYAEAEASEAQEHTHSDDWECESCGARLREDDEVCPRCYVRYK